MGDCVTGPGATRGQPPPEGAHVVYAPDPDTLLGHGDRAAVRQDPGVLRGGLRFDYSPNVVRHGRHHIQEAVERSHAAFEGFREEIKTIVADDERVVIHFAIKGEHAGQWGPLAGTGKDVAFDEIVIMTVRHGKVAHRTGVIDNVTGLRQVGVMPAARP